MKFMKDLRIWLILAVFVSVACILFGGQALTAKIRVDNPLQKALLARVEVENFKIVSKSNGLQLELALKKTENLQMTLEFIKEQVELYHKKPLTEFLISGKSNPRLEELRYALSFYLEEAVASGRYTQLKAALDKYEEDGLMAKVYFAARFIYIQLEDGDHYFYQAIPRSGTGRISGPFNLQTGGEMS